MQIVNFAHVRLIPEVSKSLCAPKARTYIGKITIFPLLFFDFFSSLAYKLVATRKNVFFQVFCGKIR